jgi:hypothetical protein
MADDNTAALGMASTVSQIGGGLMFAHGLAFVKGGMGAAEMGVGAFFLVSGLAAGVANQHMSMKK